MNITEWLETHDYTEIKLGTWESKTGTYEKSRRPRQRIYITKYRHNVILHDGSWELLTIVDQDTVVFGHVGRDLRVLKFAETRGKDRARGHFLKTIKGMYIPT